MIDIFTIKSRIIKEKVTLEAMLYYEQNLKRSKIAKDYLKNRRINEKTIKNFILGYTNSDKPLQKHLIEKGFKIRDLYHSGLFLKKEPSLPLAVLWGNRITIPILSSQKPIMFTSRAISEEESPKCIHSKGKIKTLLNQDILEKESEIILVEGPFDLFSLHQLGFPSICLLGTGYSNKRYGHIIKKAKRITLLFDSDANGSGQKATLKTATEICMEKDLDHLDVFICELPIGEDCNSLYIKKEEKIITNRINKAYNFRKSRNFQIIKERIEKRKREKERRVALKKTNTEDISCLKVASLYGEPQKFSEDKAFFLCPFNDHDEQEPSFVVYLDSNSFYCFGCKRHGDATSLHSRLQSISYYEAYQDLRRRLENEEK
jgi:DNA primase catalytic core